jgi:hypothetical protein
MQLLLELGDGVPTKKTAGSNVLFTKTQWRREEIVLFPTGFH